MRGSPEYSEFGGYRERGGECHWTLWDGACSSLCPIAYLGAPEILPVPSTVREK